MCAQLESSLVVFDHGKRRLGTAPIIDQLCARIHNTLSTFLGLGDGGESGLHHPIDVRSDHAHRLAHKSEGLSPRRDELVRVSDGLRHGLAMAEPQYRSEGRCTIVTRLWASRAGA